MVAASSWLLTPLTGAVIGIAGVVVGVLGCLLTIWYSLSRSRRRLLFAGHKHSHGPRKRELAGSLDTHVVELDLWLTGPADIRPADFMDDKALSFSVDGGKVLQVLGPPKRTRVYPPEGTTQVFPSAALRFHNGYVDIAPTWLPAGRLITVRLATEGPVRVDFTLDPWHMAPLADVRVVAVSRWRLRLKRAVAKPVPAIREGIAVGIAAVTLVLLIEGYFWVTFVFRPRLHAEGRRSGEIYHLWEFFRD